MYVGVCLFCALCVYPVKDKEQKSAGTYFYLDTDDEVDDHPLVTKDQKKKAEKAVSEMESCVCSP